MAALAALYDGLPPEERAVTCILTSNYGEAGLCCPPWRYAFTVPPWIWESAWQKAVSVGPPIWRIWATVRGGHR